jgi:hypothetical protein
MSAPARRLQRRRRRPERDVSCFTSIRISAGSLSRSNWSDLPNLNRMGFSDRAASMRIEEGYWMFCTDAQFRGDCRTLGPGEYARLPGDVDRRIASVRRVNEVYGAASSSYRHLR